MALNNTTFMLTNDSLQRRYKSATIGLAIHVLGFTLVLAGEMNNHWPLFLPTRLSKLHPMLVASTEKSRNE